MNSEQYSNVVILMGQPVTNKHFAEKLYFLYLKCLTAYGSSTSTPPLPNEINKALNLRNIVHKDGFNLDIVEHEQYFFERYAKQIGEIISKTSINDQINFFSHSAALLV